MTTTADVSLLEITRIFDASPERVFDAWMVREQWQSWIGPGGVDCQVPLLDARVGGHYKVIMHLSDGRVVPVVGTFTEIEKPTRVVFTWKWEGDEGDTRVTLNLRDLGGRTELTLRHEGLRTAENRDGHEKGWNGTLNKLVDFLAHAEAGPKHH